MAEYIKRTDVMKICEGYSKHCFSSNDAKGQDIADRILDDVVEIPSADVEEVKHGTWYHGMENGSVYAKCSACNRKMNYSCYGYARCSLCGAKMDGGNEE